MIGHSLKIGLRKFIKKPAFSIINVLGLAIGLACFVLTMVYVNYELNYDHYYPNRDRTYLVSVNISFADYNIENQTYTTARLAETLNETFPEVERATQVAFGFSSHVLHNDHYYKELAIAASDSSYFDVFPQKFIMGDPKKALCQARSVVITEKIAQKYFGDENAYGKTLNLFDTQFKITGIIKDQPENTSFKHSMIVSLYTWKNWYSDPQWQNNNFMTFLLLRKDACAMDVEAKFPDLLKEKITSIKGQDFESWLADGNRWEYNLFSIKEVYLDLWGNGIYIFGFGIVAVFLLVIASINYMNLSTAKSSQRAKEIGVRKAVGAYKTNLIRQFLAESILMSFISLVIGMGMVEAMLPFLSDFVDKSLKIHYFDNVIVLPSLLLLGLIIGIISGLYPSFILSAFSPLKVLKGDLSNKSKGFTLRNVLVLLQFVISITLIVSLFIVVKQTDLLYTKKLGYDKRNLMVLPSGGSIANTELFRNEIKQLPEIENITFTSRVPNRSSGPSNQWTPEGKETTLFNIHIADQEFLETMRIKLHKGRYFNKKFRMDTASVVINQAAARFLNWGDTLNKKIENGVLSARVIGIIEDYHFQTLHSEIKPLLILFRGDGYNVGYRRATIRIKEGMDAPIEKIEEIFNKHTFEKNTEFEYYFFEERYRTYYAQQEQTKKLMLILTGLILFVTALGLYGLASYAIQEKMKEIAIRKAIGSSTFKIISRLSWNFTKIVIIANIIAWPIAWYFMSDWLDSFAYRINIHWWIFALTALISYVFAMLTIIYQAFVAANKNPVDVLRYE